MKRLICFTTLFLVALVMVSGCGIISSQNTNTKTQTTLKAETNNTQLNNSNILTDNILEAAEIPKMFYEFLNNKDYNKAVSLLGPTLKFEGDPSTIKYLRNLQHTDISDFKDISSENNLLDRTQQSYYAVKIYYAKLTIQIKDKSLVPQLVYPQYRRFIVVKQTKNSPWLLDGDEDVPPKNI